MHSRTADAAVVAVGLLAGFVGRRRGWRADINLDAKHTRIGDLLITWSMRARSADHPLIDGASGTFTRGLDGVEVERWQAGGVAIRLSPHPVESGPPVPIVFVGLKDRRCYNPWTSRLTARGRAHRLALATRPHLVSIHDGASRAPRAAAG